MARKPNYDFEKRKKEQERKAKKEAKAQRKRDAKEDADIANADDLAGLGIDVTAVPGADEETTAPEQQVE